MRSVVLDTETTGMPVTDGHRIIEIGCVELMGRRLTGRHFHVYLHQDRDIDEVAIAGAEAFYAEHGGATTKHMATLVPWLEAR